MDKYKVQHQKFKKEKKNLNSSLTFLFFNLNGSNYSLIHSLQPARLANEDKNFRI